MSTALDWINGICWSIVYLIAIVAGIRKKTYCIPAVCICLNFSWEFWVVLVRIMEQSPLSSGFVSQLLWLILDVGVLWTWMRDGQGVSIKKKWMLLIGAAALMAAVTVGAGRWLEAAFSINLIMSVAFLYQTDQQVYRSAPIAFLKCIGTFAATILNGMIDRNLFALAIGGMCLIADVCYINDLWKNKKYNGVNQ